MRFNEWPQLTPAITSRGVKLPTDPAQFAKFVNQNFGEPQASILCMEHGWAATKRPYYRIYPVASDILTRMRMDIAWQHVRLPVDVVSFHFAEGHEVQSEDGFLMHSLLIQHVGYTDGKRARWCIMADVSKKGERVVTGLQMVGTDTETVEDSVTRAANSSRAEFSRAPDTLRLIARLLAGAALLSGDPDIVTRDVLARDEAKQEATDDPDQLQKLVDRAIRRGRNGWSIGKTLETTPHYRRPHFGLRWCGPGRAVPRIVPVKGAVVHRDKITNVPTGLKDTPAQSPDITPALQLEEEFNERLNRPKD